MVISSLFSCFSAEWHQGESESANALVPFQARITMILFQTERGMGVEIELAATVLKLFEDCLQNRPPVSVAGRRCARSYSQLDWLLVTRNRHVVRSLSLFVPQSRQGINFRGSSSGDIASHKSRQRQQQANARQCPRINRRHMK